jgi:hypothetical protein
MFIEIDQVDEGLAKRRVRKAALAKCKPRVEGNYEMFHVLVLLVR